MLVLSLLCMRSEEASTPLILADESDGLSGDVACACAQSAFAELGRHMLISIEHGMCGMHD